MHFLFSPVITESRKFDTFFLFFFFAGCFCLLLFSLALCSLESPGIKLLTAWLMEGLMICRSAPGRAAMCTAVEFNALPSNSASKGHAYISDGEEG